MLVPGKALNRNNLSQASANFRRGGRNRGATTKGERFSPTLVKKRGKKLKTGILQVRRRHMTVNFKKKNITNGDASQGRGGGRHPKRSRKLLKR